MRNLLGIIVFHVSKCVRPIPSASTAPFQLRAPPTSRMLSISTRMFGSCVLYGSIGGKEEVRRERVSFDELHRWDAHKQMHDTW
mmetsp:Transcript_72327/g.193387  ORF Transcript_72327/g.193387 Transcript_72327/m.193387 type:complete len:84 (+) Transcript_72327:62-313(+)